MSIDVEVYDASAPLWLSVSDVYRPILSRFEPSTIPLDEYGHIEHIDVVTMWKGLSTIQHAEELLFWEKALHDALSSTVEEWLLDSFGKHGVQLDLDYDDASEPLLQIQELINDWGIKSISCNLRKLVDHMLWYHECSGVLHPWLLSCTDYRVAIENFIHVHFCFGHYSNGIRVYFTSHLSDMNLQIFAAVQSKPHPLYIDEGHDGMSIEFKTPLLNPCSSLYRIEKKFSHSSCSETMWQGTVGTDIHGVTFERIYRFRLHLPPGNAQPERVDTPLCAPVPAFVDREQTLRPSRTLRELSNGDVRVQGARTDLEREAERNHPGFFNTHQDLIIGKAAVLGKLVDQMPPADFTVNMVHRIRPEVPDPVEPSQVFLNALRQGCLDALFQEKLKDDDVRLLKTWVDNLPHVPPCSPPSDIDFSFSPICRDRLNAMKSYEHTQTFQPSIAYTTPRLKDPVREALISNPFDHVRNSPSRLPSMRIPGRAAGDFAHQEDKEFERIDCGTPDSLSTCEIPTPMSG